MNAKDRHSNEVQATALLLAADDKRVLELVSAIEFWFENEELVNVFGALVVMSSMLKENMIAMGGEKDGNEKWVFFKALIGEFK